MSDPRVTGEPVDGFDELFRVGENLARIGSCSMPSSSNKGCAYFPICRFKKYRDEARRPGNVAVATVLADGVANVSIKSCWLYYQSGDHNDRRNSDKSGNLVEVLGYEGDIVEVRSNVAAHPKPDKFCEGCLKGACLKREEKMIPTEVPVFETWTSRRTSSQGAKLKQALLDSVPVQDQGRIQEHLDREASRRQASARAPEPQVVTGAGRGGGGAFMRPGEIVES